MKGSQSMKLPLSIHMIECVWDSSFSPLQDDNILVLFKLEAFADDSFSVAQMLEFTFGRVENIVGKGENAGYQHFLLPTMF